MRVLLIAILGVVAVPLVARGQISNLATAVGAPNCISNNTCSFVVNNTKRLVYTAGCTLSTAPGSVSEADLNCSGGGGGGTVTSVGLALPVSVFTVTGSPVVGAGTLTGSFNTQTANLVFAGPASGVPAVPTFRALVAADLPASTTTLQNAYDNGPSGVILTSVAGGALLFRDVAGGLGGTVFGVQNSAGTVKYVDVLDNGPMALHVAQANAAVLDISSLNGQVAEFFSDDVSSGSQLRFYNPNNSLQLGGLEAYNSPQRLTVFTFAMFSPDLNLGASLGEDSRAWSVLKTPLVDAGTVTTTTLGIGQTNATAVNVGHSGITTTITGGLTQLTGAFSLTGNAASQISTAVGGGAVTISGAAGINEQRAGTTIIDIGVTSSTAAIMASQNAFGLGAFTTTQINAYTCIDGEIAWDSTIKAQKYCKSNAWFVLGGSEWDFSAFIPTVLLGASNALQQTKVSNASTIESATITIVTAGILGANLVEKLCSDAATCAAGNTFVTCTVACATAIGTVTSCTVNNANVSAGLNLTWSVQTACTTTNPAANVNAHFTNP